MKRNNLGSNCKMKHLYFHKLSLLKTYYFNINSLSEFQYYSTDLRLHSYNNLTTYLFFVYFCFLKQINHNLMKLKISLLLFASLFCAGISFPQSNTPHNLNIESGMSNNYIKTIFKDSQGLMWFGTETGLDSYDGQQIINYAKRFKTPLKGAVQAIVECKPGVLLVGTSWGAFRYTLSKNEIAPINFGIPAIDVRTIFTSSKGILYVATDRGLFTLNKITLQAKPFPLKGKSSVSLTDILEDHRGNIWIAGNVGLFEILPNQRVVLHNQIYPNGQNIKVLKLIGNALFLGTLRGLFAFDITSNKLTQLPKTEDISILSMTTDGAGKLYIGTDNFGIWEVNTLQQDAKIANFGKASQEKLSSNTIDALYFDNAQTLWIGSFDGGIDFWNLQKSKKFETIVIEGKSSLRSMYFAKDGRKFVGTRDGSLLCLDSNNRVKAKVTSMHGKNFRSNILTTIYPFSGQPDLLLIGTFGGGITVLNTKTLTCTDFSKNKVFQTETIYKFCTDRKHQLWIATLDGLYRYQSINQSIQKFEVSKLTGSNEIFTLFSDATDKIWIGTKTGVCYYSISREKLVQPESCKPYRFQCTSTFVDSKGNSWFCFNKGGVLELDANLNQKIWLTKEIGLPENAPSSLIEDREGNVWVGTSKGLYKVSRNHGIHAYGKEDGLTGVAFCPESATKDANGGLWWSNERGMVNFVNDKSAVNTQVPPIKFTDIIINGKRFDADTLSETTSSKPSKYALLIKGKTNNNLEFRVAALNYKNSQRNQYTFLLQGIDKTWSKPSTSQTATYNELAAGTYTLKVKASNNDDVWTPTATEIKVTISPWFYETTWFVVLIWALIGSAIIYFTRSYIIHMKVRIMAQLEEIKKRQTNSSPTLKIAEKKGNEILVNLQNYMQNEKPFLSPELRQADVANSIGCTVHELSQVINTQLNQNFSDFVNSHRVEEVKQRINNGDNLKYTLTAIALQCGFSSKSSFLRAFKKATGLNPSDYMKENNHSNKIE